ncbi:MAG: HAMP domain-containing histidine kinase [Oscillatoriophycideae cyanobacterium NC_groundwater_1537_Pr4_S-0.65um_50_18]|nr:HAMP domain-containing histidine kinase [Oscillatoriophycideae cyanobacterium NC_groundwater_1537_Pr4_S-0.65um_50_18]
MDITTCLLMTEGQQECWQTLCHAFTARLAATEIELQKAHADYQQVEAQRQQLAEQLEEAQAQQQALTDAATAQARQFSETLKQLRQNQAQIVQAEKMSSLGQLVAGVAHEINNPVNFISGNLSYAKAYIQDLTKLLALYQKHYPQPTVEIQTEAEAMDIDFLMEDLPSLLASMKMGTERIQKIVLSLRSFSRMDEAEVKEVNIHEGIDSTLMILQNRLKAKSDRPAIEVIKHYSPLPSVECYAGQLNQVFMNLLANAIDALEEGIKITQHSAPSITIWTEVLNSDRIRIRIADNGPGISEQVQQKLFDPFFTTKPVGKGTGLGLSISYQVITDRHKGTLKCSSSLGQGAEFTVEIPVRSQRK